MSALVHILTREVTAASQRQADSLRRHEQRGRHGFHRRDQFGHDDQFLVRPDLVFGVEREAEAPTAYVLDLSQPRDEHIGDQRWVAHSARNFQNIHQRIPLEYPGMLSGGCYRTLNGDDAIYGSDWIAGAGRKVVA